LKYFLYSHDTFGLGHIRRNLKIAKHLAQRGHQVLIGCSSPYSFKYDLPAGVSLLKIPGFEKNKIGNYVPREKSWTKDQLTSFRSKKFAEAITDFAPDTLLVDKEPAGINGELLESFDTIRRIFPDCRIVCGMRDILDSPIVIRSEWAKKNTVDVLSKYYDQIIVYADARMVDFSKEYNLPKILDSKLTYSNYLLDFNQKIGCKPFDYDVLGTFGGGGDGESYAKSFLSWAQNTNLKVYYLGGPHLSSDLISLATKIKNKNAQFEWSSFSNFPEDLFLRSEKVITMGGYNTLCELIGMGHKPIVLPRQFPRMEQMVRAQKFNEFGLCDYCTDDCLDGEKINKLLRNNLSLEKTSKIFFKRNGMQKLIDILENPFPLLPLNQRSEYCINTFSTVRD